MRNRLSVSDIDADHDLHLHDDLQQFLQEYEMQYAAVMVGLLTLSLMSLYGETLSG